MKKLMIVVLMFSILMGCKDNAKKEDPASQPNMEVTITETTEESVNNLDLGCYEYFTEGNDLKMEITKIEGDAVSGNLLYSYDGKDKNEGTFFGHLHGNQLLGSYTFMSEGIQSIREVVFLVGKDHLIEGFGELNDAGTTFKDTANITYSTKTPWVKVDCN